MTLRNQVLIWVGIALAGILMLFVFRGILLPFIIGLILAYLLNPLVNALQKLRIGRGWATAIVLLGVFVLVIGLIVVLVIPLVVPQTVDLVQRTPDYITALRELANQWVPAFTEWLGPERTAQVEAALNDFTRAIPGWTAAITAQLAQSGLSFFASLGLAILTPVIAFYMLLDWESMVRGIENMLPRAYKVEIQGILAEIDRSMAGVIRGQGSVVLVLCFYYAVALTLTGLNYGIAIGLISGLLSFIPYVGFAVGFVLSLSIALVQFWPNWWMILAVVLVFLIGQFLEGNILYPKLVGTSININPVWLIFALFAFSLLFGFVGLLLAVPLSAIAGVLTRFAVRKYKQSTLYLGENERPAEPAAKAAE